MANAPVMAAIAWPNIAENKNVCNVSGSFSISVNDTNNNIWTSANGGSTWNNQGDLFSWTLETDEEGECGARDDTLIRVYADGDDPTSTPAPVILTSFGVFIQCADCGQFEDCP